MIEFGGQYYFAACNDRFLPGTASGCVDEFSSEDVVVTACSAPLALLGAPDLAVNIPLVSIIIPCYNAEEWLEQTIQSALDQTYQNIEVIVVDDGSTDGSTSILKEWGREIMLEIGPNRGACAARNTGIRLARGKYIQFLDSDDILMPNCIEAKINAGDRHGVLNCCDVHLMKDSKNSDSTEKWEFGFDMVHMLRYGAPQTSVPLYPRELLLDVGGFREHLPCAQDYDLNLRLKILFKLKYESNNCVGVLIRPVENSLSRSSGSKMPYAKYDVLEEALRLLSEQEESNVEYQDAISQHMLAIARSIWGYGNINDAKRIASRAKAISKNCYHTCYKGLFSEFLARSIGFSFFEFLYQTARKIRKQRAPNRPII